MSLVALHDSELADFLNPTLTTIALPVDEMAQQAVDLVIELIDGKEPGSVVVRTAPQLKLREVDRATAKDQTIDHQRRPRLVWPKELARGGTTGGIDTNAPGGDEGAGRRPCRGPFRHRHGRGYRRRRRSVQGDRGSARTSTAADRVIDTPISEMGFLGAAVGAAVCGMKPVVEMMFVEFAGVALDALTTEAATMRYLSRGKFTVPMVMRASAGAGQGFGCQHSQMLDHWFRGTPGLKVCVPSGARTAYGLLRSAIEDPDPVVVLEPRVLYGEREEFDVDPAYRVPLGKAEIVRRRQRRDRS